MLIQSNASGTAVLNRLTSDSAPAPVVATQTQSTQTERPQVSASAAEVQKQTQPALTREQVQSAVDSLNKAMRQVNSNVEFSIDAETKHTVIKVVESTTGEIIRQFPSEEVLAITRSIDQMQQRGLLLKQTA